MRIRLQPLPAFLIIRHGEGDKFPKILSMALDFYVTELMDGHIIQDRYWSHYDSPVEAQNSALRAAPPTFLLVSDFNASRNNIQQTAESEDSLIDNFFCFAKIPQL